MGDAPWTPDQRTLEWVADRLRELAIAERKLAEALLSRDAAETRQARSRALHYAADYVRSVAADGGVPECPERLPRT